MSDVIVNRAEFVQGWRGGLPETPCGWGSTLAATQAQREWIPVMLKRYGIKTIADIGAGDLNWITKMPMNGVSYSAYDLVPRSPEVTAFDITRQVAPRADLIMCLWVLNHLPYDDCELAIANLITSGSKYLMMTDRPMWHREQPPAIQMPYLEELVLDEEKGDRIILIELNG